MNINYKKGNTNHVADYLSRPPVATPKTILKSCGHEPSVYPQLYKNDLEFTTTYHTLVHGNQVPDFHLQDALLCYLGHLCVPSRECSKLIWEGHYSQVAGQFGVEKIVVIL